MKKRSVMALAMVLFLCAVLSAGLADGEGTEIEILPGNMFYYGTFEQDNDLSNGREPILWRILDTDWEHDYMLAVSEYGLYTMNYHHSNNKTKWKDTDVRVWLNRDFASSAFTQEQRMHIAVTKVSGSKDRFFLLDESQIKKYLKEPYLCEATEYAIATGAYVNEKTQTSSWLVRMDVAQERIAWVGGAGKLYSATGSKGVNYLTSKDNVVRPVMWISQREINDGSLNESDGVAPGSKKTEPPDDLYAPTIDSTIATRSGPSTGYNGIGSYKNVDRVRVLSRVSDGSIWWLQVEFAYNGLTVRCYTGLKRVNIDINIVPDDAHTPLGAATVVQAPSAYYGPGKNYKRQVEKFTPAIGTEGEVIREENGWYCFEYERMEDGHPQRVRVWLLPEDVQLDSEPSGDPIVWH